MPLRHRLVVHPVAALLLLGAAALALAGSVSGAAASTSGTPVAGHPVITLGPAVTATGRSRWLVTSQTTSDLFGLALVSLRTGRTRTFVRSPHGGDYDSGYANGTWSRDGRSIAAAFGVLRNRHGLISGRIAIVRPGHTGMRLVPRVGLGSDTEPSDRVDWSPDDRLLVYDTGTTVRIADATSGRSQLLATHGTDPTWSRDGRWIAFAGDDQQVWLIHPDGSGLHTIGVGYEPAWAPDSRTLAFTSGRDHHGESCYEDPPCIPNGEIYRADVDGSDVARLTDTRADDYWPTWSPDGRRIAFQSITDDVAQRFGTRVMNPDGRCGRWLSHHALGRPAWQPGTGHPAACRTPTSSA